MTRDNLNVFKLSPVKLPPGIVWPCQAAESPGNKADPVAICTGKSSNLLDHILGWSRSTSWTLSDTLQNCFGFWASASAVMLVKQCYKPAMFWWFFTQDGGCYCFTNIDLEGNPASAITHPMLHRSTGRLYLSGGFIQSIVFLFPCVQWRAFGTISPSGSFSTTCHCQHQTQKLNMIPLILAFLMASRQCLRQSLFTAKQYFWRTVPHSDHLMCVPARLMRQRNPRCKMIHDQTIQPLLHGFFFPYCILIHSDPLWSTPIHSVLGETDNLWCDGPMPHQTPRASGVRRAVGMRGFKDSRKMFVAPPKDSNNYDGELNCFFLFWGFD